MAGLYEHAVQQPAALDVVVKRPELLARFGQQAEIIAPYVRTAPPAGFDALGAPGLNHDVFAAGQGEPSRWAVGDDGHDADWQRGVEELRGAGKGGDFGFWILDFGLLDDRNIHN